MMGRGAGFEADEAGLKPIEERQKLRPTQLMANNDHTARIDRMNLKDVLGDIQTNRDARLHGRSPLAGSKSPAYGDLPPLKWSSLKYGFGEGGTGDGKEKAYGRRDRREAKAG
jgi:hypothetical protein